MKRLGIIQKLLLLTQFGLMLALPTTCLADLPVIKIAILDNMNDPYLPTGYINSYISGINTAAMAAKANGYTIEYKSFFYNNTPLAILNEVPAVNAWQPDLIIGPHSSNQLLLLKNSFKNTMVLSPYASDPAIANLPNNFYSLDLLDQDLGHIVVKFISGEFPNANLINVVNADCKDCVDITNIISTEYGSSYPKAQVTTNMYTGDISTVDVNKLINNYKAGDIILPQPDTYIELQQLMYRLANHVGGNPIFVTVLDNLGDPSKIAKSTNYTEYWFTPHLFDNNSPNFQAFSKYYQTLYGCPPKDTISYTVYLTILSATDALKLYPNHGSNNMRANILASYSKARQADPHWYKTSTYAIYKIDSQETKLIGTISAFD
jgi:hypothetical protein